MTKIGIIGAGTGALHVGVRSRKKGKINIRGVLIELLGFHV